jgi:hypothetical protein
MLYSLYYLVSSSIQETNPQCYPATFNRFSLPRLISMTSSHGRLPKIDNNLEQMIVRVLAVRSADIELYYFLFACNNKNYCELQYTCLGTNLNLNVFTVTFEDAKTLFVTLPIDRGTTLNLCCMSISLYILVV